MYHSPLPQRSQGALDTTGARNNRVDLMSTCSPLSASSSLFTKSAHFYCNAHATDVTGTKVSVSWAMRWSDPTEGHPAS